MSFLMTKKVRSANHKFPVQKSMPVGQLDQTKRF